MKRFWLSIPLWIGCLVFSPIHGAGSNALLQLEEMRKASLTLDYELNFINIKAIGIESMRYRHAIVDHLSLAQLLQMDGAAREVLQRGSEISYFFEQGIEPFSITGDHIIDSLPEIVFADFQHLQKNYDFVPIGQARVANRRCQMIRIVAHDGFRYNYVLWVDDETKLPIQIELLDRNGERLEQFRVISLVLGAPIQRVMKTLLSLELPPVILFPESEPVSLQWSLNWLPKGFNEVSQGKRVLPQIQSSVESRLFSDGLFSFSVNVTPINTSVTEQFLHQGKNILHVEARDGKEVIIVGEIPLATAKRIAENLSFVKRNEP